MSAAGQTPALTFEKMVAVGQNPEHIIEEDGKLYLVNSGFGYDNRLSIIDIKTFDLSLIHI